MFKVYFFVTGIGGAGDGGAENIRGEGNGGGLVGAVFAAEGGAEDDENRHHNSGGGEAGKTGAEACTNGGNNIKEIFAHNKLLDRITVIPYYHIQQVLVLQPTNYMNMLLVLQNIGGYYGKSI